MQLLANIQNLWSRVTDVVVGGVTYGVDYFQNIASAIAAAVGFVLMSVFQGFIEMMIVARYFWEVVHVVLSQLGRLAYNVYLFFYYFVSSVGDIPAAGGSPYPGVVEVLFEIPAWQYFSGIISLMILAIAAFYAIRFAYQP